VSCADVLDVPSHPQLAEAPAAPVPEARPGELDAGSVELVANGDRLEARPFWSPFLLGCVPLRRPGTVSAEAESCAGQGSDAPDAGIHDARCSASQFAGPNGNCYAILTTLLSWVDARQSCRALGQRWDLASIRDAQSNQFLAGLSSDEAWIGASDAEQEGTWIWVDDGRPFWSGGGDAGSAVSGAYVNWISPDPNGGTNSNCARVVPASAMGWADLSCAALRGAVCEGPPG